MTTQKEFEIQSHKRAVQKLEQQVRTAKEKAYYSSTQQARETIKHFVVPIAEMLTDYYQQAMTGRACTTATASIANEMLGWIEHLSALRISAITLKTVFDIHGIFDKVTPAQFASMLGTRIEDEVRFRYYETVAPPDVVAAMTKRINESGSSPTYRRISTKLITEKLLDAEDKGHLKWKPWDHHYRNVVGLSLLDFCGKQGLVTKTVIQGAKRRSSVIELTDEMVTLQDEMFADMCGISYIAYPLIEKPIPWEHQDGVSRFNTTGGYHTDWIREQKPLCRGYHYNTEFGQSTVDFLNTVSNTAWIVDHNVHEVSQILMDRQSGVGSFRTLREDPRLKQGMPEHIQALPTDHVDRRGWRHEQKLLHEAQKKDNQRAIRSITSTALANEFLARERFWLTWSCDYRGRAYSVQPWLQPHTTDSEKALLKFADGCKVDARAEWWCAQAVGAAYLGSRLNFQQRIQWTYDNKELITAVALDPVGTTHLWEQAKDKWQFMQLAIEWHKVVLTKQEHLWHVPVGVDATASGLQLLSSILRDPQGMRFSNVIPSLDLDAPPEDSYLEVLRVARLLAAEQEETKHLAEFLVYRNVGKTTMVMLYNASHTTVREKVLQAFIDEGLYGTAVSYSDVCAMTKLVIRASKQVFPKGFAALDWLVKLARLSIKNGNRELSWRTPNGDTIRLQEFEALTDPVRLSHLGKVSIAYGRGELDTESMISAFCPGYVHSLDAALLKTAFQDWNKPLVPIHDCIKCLPSDMDDALERIRRAFYHVCDGNPLDRVANDLGVSPEQLPRLKQGDADLKQVLNSIYLFN